MSDSPGPALATAASNLRRASIWLAEGDGPGAAPPRPRAIGAASHAMVTLGARADRSQSSRSRSPASYWLRVTRPRANSQPSGDSARLTVTERAGRRTAGPLPEGAGASLGPIARSRSSRVDGTLAMSVLPAARASCHTGETVGQ